MEIATMVEELINTNSNRLELFEINQPHNPYDNLIATKNVMAYEIG